MFKECPKFHQYELYKNLVCLVYLGLSFRRTPNSTPCFLVPSIKEEG